jgi:hypothetical protein
MSRKERTEKRALKDRNQLWGLGEGAKARCRIEKKEENGANTNQKAPEDFPVWKCSKKMQRKKTITTIQIHYYVEITKSKTERETTNMITAQVKEIKEKNRRSSFLLQREKYTRQNLAEL